MTPPPPPGAPDPAATLLAPGPLRRLSFVPFSVRTPFGPGGATDRAVIVSAPRRPDSAAPPVGTLSPPVAPAAVAGVLRAYRTGPAVEVVPVAEGLLNRGYRVVTDSGTYFLKCYVDQDTATRPAISAQHRATTGLHRLGLPTAPPLRSRGGRTVVVYHGRLFALFPWVEGEHRHGTELDQQQCGELGALLGRLHGALGRLCAPVPQPAGHRSADPAETERLIQHLRHRARLHRPYSPFDALAERRLTERLELLAAHRHRRPAPEDAPPTGWTHGDFHSLNLLYRAGRVAAVLDWDKLGLRPRAEETVRAATLIFNDRVSGVLDLVRVRRYSQAYRATGAATAAELAAAVHRVWWERLNDFWMLQWRYQRGDHRADALFPAAAGQLAWWCQEYEQVMDAFTN